MSTHTITGTVCPSCGESPQDRGCGWCATADLPTRLDRWDSLGEHPEDHRADQDDRDEGTDDDE